MGTLANLKSRIAQDLKRTDLTTHIAGAIEDAIADYNGRRFAFNQVRATFVTVAGTEFYAAGAGASDIPVDVAEVDGLTITVGGRLVMLRKWSFSAGEGVNSTSTLRGQPTCWSWYANKVRLYPIPGAVYTLTMSYLQRIQIPSADGNSNVWTTEAEQLIRACAEKILYRDVLASPRTLAAQNAEQMAYRRLKREALQLDTGSLAPSGI